jgi:hypothetical protein
MGASFQTMSLNGSLTRNEVRDHFAQAQDQDRYENGHSYSGGFGMARGLSFASKNTFESEQEAEWWLDKNCQKWEAAIAVEYLNEKRKTAWLIGAVCAS